MVEWLGHQWLPYIDEDTKNVLQVSLLNNRDAVKQACVDFVTCTASLSAWYKLLLCALQCVSPCLRQLHCS
jgi:hypothetical protein